MANNENYTLQRFYFEVKALIETSPNLVKELGNTTLEVSFIIEENELNKPITKVCINNTRHFGKEKNGKEYLIGIYDAKSPADALNMLRDLVNKYNGDEIKDRLSLEVKEGK